MRAGDQARSFWSASRRLWLHRAFFLSRVLSAEGPCAIYIVTFSAIVFSLAFRNLI